MLKQITHYVKSHKKVIIPASAGALFCVFGVVLALILGGGSKKLSFSEKMITESVVNEMCDISEYVINPQGKILKLTATYKDDNGEEKNWLVAGMAFKPTRVGETRVKVEADDGETIEAVIEITEGAPTLVTTKEAKFYLEETIELADLMDYVEYKSTSVPDFKVLSMVFGADTIDLTGETKYTFKEIGNYAFNVEISNSAGNASGTIVAKVMPEMTEKEKDDLTNNIRLSGGPQVAKALDKEFHAENSDWSWKCTANAANVWDNEQTNKYYTNSFIIDFGKEVDISQYYFTMDMFANENTYGVGIHYINSADIVAPTPMGFQDILGKWTQISSQGKQTEGLYTGLYIMVLHSQDVGNYNPSDVTVWFDNLQLHQYPDPNAPIIVGGTTDYDITSSKVTWNSRLEDNGSNGNFVQFNRTYTNQTLTFTTTIRDAKKPNLTIGARMDGANTFVGANTGLLVKFYNEFFEVYAPKFGDKMVGAANVFFESGKKYTFAYSVETLNGQDIFFLKINEEGGKEILNYSLELPSGVVNKKGNFVIWSPESEMTITYSEPETIARKANINVIVPVDGKAGTAGISTATPDEITKASYVAFEGEYTKEQLQFTTTIEDGNKPNLVIGVRMQGIHSNPFIYEGLTLRIYNEFFEVYAPKYGTLIGAENLWLTSGKTYTFKLNVETVKGKSIMTFIVEEAGSAILHYQLKDIADVLPKSGKFMIWSMNEDTDIKYEMPAVAVIPTNKNVEVEKDGKAATVTLESIEPNVIAKSSYLAIKGNYTNETFSFTTKLTNAEKPNLIIGARMKGVESYVGNGEGVMIQLYKNFYEVYGEKYGVDYLLGAANYSTANPEESLAVGVDYTFEVQVVDDKLIFAIKLGNSIVHSKLYDVPTSVAKSGNFMVWNADAKREISYKMPVYVEPLVNKNKVVESTSEAGTAELKTVEQDTYSYLALKGNYTNETFSFTTKIANTEKPNLIIGARMKGVESYVGNGEGLMIRLYKNFYEVYGEKYGVDYLLGAANYSTANPEEPLAVDVDYTFEVQVVDGKLVFTIKLGDTIVHSASYDVPSGVSESGNFMVWNADAKREISYKMPVYVEPLVNTNKVVESTEEAGTVELKTVEQDTYSYLAMKGNYTNETFSFTTKIANAEKPNLIIGARMKGVESYVGNGEGLMIRLYKNFYEVYGEKYGVDYLLGAANYSTVNPEEPLAVDVDYTFEVQVVDGKLVFTIKLEDTIVHSASYDVPSGVSESGNFMVWNADAKREISYKMPVYVAPLVNTNKVVESTEEAGTVELKTVEQNKYSYLAMKGDYTNETFTFKTTISDPEKPNLVIGLHMPGISEIPSAHQGIMIDLKNFYYAFYAPNFGDDIHATWYSATGGESWRFEKDVEYTFVVKVEDNTLYFTIKNGDTVIHTFTKALPTGASTSGSFIVWNLDEERTIAYDMPVVIQPQKNTNKEVESTDEAGSAVLKTIDENMLEAASYLAMKGGYTDEIFTFKTKIANAEVPNLVIGAHVKDVDGNVETAEGIIIRLSNFFYAVYGPDYADADQLGAAHYSATGGESWRFDVDKEYTFTVQVKGGKVYLTVKEEDAVLHTASYNVPSTVATSGHFMVWNMDVEREIAYEMPLKETSSVPTGAALEVEGTSGSAVLQAPVTGNVENMAYMITKADYTTETFEVTTTIEAGDNPNLWLGARINPTIDPPYYPSILGSKGILIGIKNNFYVVYSPMYGNNEHAKNYYTNAADLSGTYTFSISVDESGTLVFTVKQNGQEIHSNTLTGRTGIPTQGKFMVSATESSRAFDWSIVKEELVAESAVTIPVGTTSGKVKLKPATANDWSNLGYIATASKYSVQTFETTVTIAEGENPNLILGGRVNSIFYPSIYGVGSNVGGGGAVMIALYNNYYAVYSPTWGSYGQAANYYTNQASLSGTYTFAIKVVTVGGNSTCYFKVTQGDTLIHEKSFNLGNVLQETGNFVVWSTNGERTIAYKIKED